MAAPGSALPERRGQRRVEVGRFVTHGRAAPLGAVDPCTKAGQAAGSSVASLLTCTTWGRCRTLTAHSVIGAASDMEGAPSQNRSMVNH